MAKVFEVIEGLGRVFYFILFYFSLCFISNHCTLIDREDFQWFSLPYRKLEVTPRSLQ